MNANPRDPAAATAFSPWRALVALARFTPWLYLASGLFASVMFYLFPLLPGLVIRRFFDTLAATAGQAGSGPANAAAGDQLWWLMALLAGIAVGRVTALLAASFAENSLHVVAGTLMRANLQIGRAHV